MIELTMMMMRRLGIEDDDEEESLYKKLGRGVVAAKKISICTCRDRLIDFCLELGLSIVDAMVLHYASIVTTNA